MSNKCSWLTRDKVMMKLKSRLWHRNDEKTTLVVYTVSNVFDWNGADRILFQKHRLENFLNLYMFASVTNLLSPKTPRDFFHVARRQANQYSAKPEGFLISSVARCILVSRLATGVTVSQEGSPMVAATATRSLEGSGQETARLVDSH